MKVLRIILVALAFISLPAHAKDDLTATRNVANEAFEQAKKAAEQGDAFAQFRLGLHYVDGRGVAKDDAEAAKWFRKAAEQGNANGQFELGYLYENGKGVAKDEVEAVKWYQKAAALGNADAKSRMEADLTRKGKLTAIRQKLAIQKNAEALAALKNAASQGPYNEDTRYQLGRAMETQATPEEMVAYYREAIASDPKPQTSSYFLAIGLERQGKPDQAIEALKKALEIDPAHEMSQNRWGAILEKQNRLTEALDHYLLAVEIHPEFKAAHENCARILGRLSRPTEAQKHRQLAMQSDIDTPKRFLYWGRYLVKQGRFSAAVAELRIAVQVNPQDSEAKRLLNQALKNSGVR